MTDLEPNTDAPQGDATPAADTPVEAPASAEPTAEAAAEGEAPAVAVATPPAPKKRRGPYTWGLGRRKSAVARVRVRSGSGNFVVNGRPVDEYFTTLETQNRARSPLVAADSLETYDVFVNVNGGGPTGQSGAVELGLARALKDVNPAVFEVLREGGHLTRDARMKERKKYGRRGARRGFQFSKR